MPLNFLLQLFQLWLLGAPSLGSSVLRTSPTIVIFFLSTFFFFLWRKMLQAHLEYL